MFHYSRFMIGRKTSVPAHTVLIEPDPVAKSSTLATITTDPATATPTGGVGPFTYQWTWDTADDGIVILSPTAATTQFRRTSSVKGNFYIATARCTVTDTGNGNITAYDTVSVQINRT